MRRIIILLTLLIGLQAYSQLTADFSLQVIPPPCAPMIIKADRIDISPGVTSYWWDLGTGGPLIYNVDTISALYPIAGTYTISLTISNGVQTSVKTQIITVHKHPVADFTANNEGCIPLDVTFSDNSTLGDSPITSWYWDFKDATTSTSPGPVKTYAAKGSYGVYLKVTDGYGCFSTINKDNFVKTYNQPFADFSSASVSSCNPPVTVNFTNLSSSEMPVIYEWLLGNGDKSADKDPVYTYKNAGTFTVRLKAFNNNNCSATKVMNSYITVTSSNYSADFDMFQDGKKKKDHDTICPGMIKCVSRATGGNTHRWLLVEPNITFEGDSFQIDYKQPGGLTIQFSASVDGNCEKRVSKYLVVEGSYHSWSMPKYQFCEYPISVQTINNSVNVSGYTWVLDDDTISNARAPLVTITSPHKKASEDYSHVPANRSHLLILNTKTPAGCKAKLMSVLSVMPPLSRFIADPVSGCVPLTVTFRDTSSVTDSVTMQWVFDDGDILQTTDYEKTVTHSYNTRGDFDSYMILTDKNGCKDTSYNIQILAGDKLYPDFTVSPSTVCAGESLTLTDLTGGSVPVDSWHYSSENAGLQTFCNGSKDVTVRTLPKRSGPAPVTLSVEDNGCFSFITKNNLLTIKGPVCSFKPMIDCSKPRTYRFDGSIFDATSIQWDFGDAQTAVADTEPEHQYLASGNYRVILRTDNAGTGCHMEDTHTVRARRPKAHIWFNDSFPICAFEPLKFYGDSSVDFADSCNMMGFEWFFGDDNSFRITREPETEHTFYKPGFPTIRLKVTDVNGCWDTMTLKSKNKPIQINMPLGDFAYSRPRGCTPSDTFTFTNKTVDASVATWWWYCNSSSGDTMQNVIKKTLTASATSQIDIILHLVDTNGCTNNIVKNVELLKPISDFSVSNAATCLGQACTFNRVAGSLDSVFWTYGDGFTGRTDGSHTYATRGDYTVSMIAYESGCRDTTIKTDAVIIQRANASFTLSDSTLDCYPAAVQFTNLDKDDPAVNGGWTFDATHTAAIYSKVSTYTYTKPGNFITKLWVETANGCRDSSSIPITVNGPYAEISANPLLACKDAKIHFTISQMKDVKDFRWFFGDGSTSDDSFPDHSYSQGGIYLPSLWFVDEKGCEPPKVTGNSVAVSEVKALFVLSDTTPCVDQRFVLNNKSGNGSSYKWDFGNGITSNYTQPTITYPVPGDYLITLLAANTKGCKDTFTKTIRVFPVPVINASGPDTICVESSAGLMVTYNDPGSKIHWSPETIVLGDTAKSNLSPKPSVSTEFTVIITDTKGCSAEDKVFVHVQQHPAELVPGEYRIAIGDTVHMNAVSEFPTKYTWTPADYLSCTGCSISVAKPLVSMLYTVNRVDRCFATSNTYTITVVERYTLDVPTTFTPNGDGVNDVVYVKGFGIKDLVEFKIYNRWGNLVFQTSNIDEGWDGTFNGKSQPTDSYVYYVKIITYKNDEVVEKKGTVTLLH